MQARIIFPARAVRVPLFSGWVLAFLLVFVLALAVGAQVPREPNQPAGGVVLPNEPVATRGPTEPYVAEVVGNDVYIRSGAGTHFYQCGKLYAGDRVQVVKTQQGWSCIVPTPACFSWISMQYVSINMQNPTMGIVTGDSVGIYAGSDFVEPMHSTSKQVVLNRGQTVKLLGEEKDDYYKIAPPQGAFLWVSSQFLQSTEKPAAKPPVPDANAVARSSTAKRPIDPNAGPLTGLDLYYALSDLVKAERAKPLSGQNYAEIKKKLAGLAATKDGGRAARYAEYTLKQVERYEMACTAAKELELQNREKQKINEKIDAARATKLAQVDDRSKFAIVGKLETSSVYVGPTRRYRILDDTGKTVCYVTPTGPAVKTDFSKLIGHKVGLVGKIEAHESTSRPFIEFIEIVLLD
ncbi:MAG: hypothetical protein A2Y76_02805 [Planctomycetes bacterium RBG_13_60_9]|nr:MAG: hypothetical protein A2Y76_02805 [Planctomycetes bacterium RBG_13_60_9]